MKTLRVLIISHMFPSRLSNMSGIFIYRQAEYLAKYGVECSFIVPRPWLMWPMYYLNRWKEYSYVNELLVSEKVEVKASRYLRPPGLWFRRFEGRSMAISVENTAIRWHRKNPFDVVMGVSIFPDTEAAVIVGRKLNIPVAALAVGSDVMIYTQELPILWKKLSKLMTQIDLPVGVSQMICDRMHQSGDCKRPPLCVYLGRDTKKFSAAEDKDKLRAKFGLTKQDIIAIYVGTVSYSKGVDELVTAAEKLLKEYRNFKLLCVGDGPDKHRLMELREKVGNKETVILPGFVAPDKVPSYLQVADFMVFPSHSEGMPQSLLEAMNCGLPVIATKVGGIPEAVIDGQTGLLIDAKNSGQLELAIKKMIANDEFRISAGKKALDYVNEKFDPERNAKKLAEALRSLIN